MGNNGQFGDKDIFDKIEENKNYICFFGFIFWMLSLFVFFHYIYTPPEIGHSDIIYFKDELAYIKPPPGVTYFDYFALHKPYAISNGGKASTSYSYYTQLSSDEIFEYYSTLMPTKGWHYVKNSENPRKMIYSKNKLTAEITYEPKPNGQNVFSICIDGEY